MSETAKKFIKRLAGFSIGPVLSALIGFITVPILTRLVDPSEFGKSAMFTLSIGVISIVIYIGIQWAYVREYHVVEDKEALFRTSIIMPLFLSVSSCCLCILFYRPISILIYAEINFKMILLQSLLLPATVIIQFCELSIRMKEQARKYSLFVAFRKILVLVSQLIVLVFYKRNFEGIIIGFFVAEYLYCASIVAINSHLFRGKYTWDSQLIRKLLRYGLPLVPTTILNWILEGMDKIALRTYTDLYHVGLYSAAFKIASLLNIVQISFSSFWLPTALRWYETGVDNRKFYDVSKYLMSGTTILFCTIAVGRRLLISLLDSKYYDSYVLIPFLLFMPIMYTISEITGCGIGFSRKTELNIVISSVASLVTFCVNFTLIPLIGYVGAGISTMVAYLTLFWMKTMFSRKLWYRMPLGWHIINSLLLIVFSMICYFFDNFIIELILFLCVCMIQIPNLLKIVRALFVRHEK